ncbi:DUF2695 domain-containing protein [Desulfosporosinus hippei]|uniref:DUF2695 domain-containing protein n=1 Tax=Desulfosporosinus hippei DSM 8344 TaxID=1121419 RepID=A0A1G7YM71_9FIRM|nr:DUF2695 domain-containing protein [Desulfosporosinus hippei]SDG96920.1 Protein of unknown function [Desulfosporosinus hippei DSM 8344]
MQLSNDQETDNLDIDIENSENLGSKPQVLSDKKLIKEEVKRRLISGIQTAALEYDSLFNEEKATLNKDYVLLSLLFRRMFFYKLNEKLSGLSCDHTLRLTKQILTQMQFKRGKINEIIDVFKKNGGQCDCEILYNVESQLIGK